jgi:hypothetical protein
VIPDHKQDKNHESGLHTGQIGHKGILKNKQGHTGESLRSLILAVYARKLQRDQIRLRIRGAFG